MPPCVRILVVHGRSSVLREEGTEGGREEERDLD